MGAGSWLCLPMAESQYRQPAAGAAADVIAICSAAVLGGFFRMGVYSKSAVRYVIVIVKHFHDDLK